MTREPQKNGSPMPLSSKPPPSKKKRSLPGMPDPDAEVIALSPNTLLATNPFKCEICSKGFQREQNLQLHQRGHNMPWKLRQQETSEKKIRKKVYVCPEPSCVHHNPSRALGDISGVKKHFYRKHGEKKWKCERCSKKYGAECDWKAHIKSCGTKEHKCDCGTLFSRRDSFVEHKALCNESGRGCSTSNSNVVAVVSSSPVTPPLNPSVVVVVSPTLSSTQCSDIAENPTSLSPPSSNASTSTSTSCCSSFSNLMSSLAHSDSPAALSITEPTTLSLFTPLYLSNNNNNESPLPHYSPALSATALLQKAAQVGSSSSNASLLRALGLKENSVSISSTATDQWNDHHHVKQENELVADYLGLGLPCGNEMIGSSCQPMTRDLLGLSMGLGRGDDDDDDLSALLTSFEGNLDSSPP